MPFRLDDAKAKIQFVTSAEMPSLIYKACLTSGVVSGTVYCQHALVAALARDLGLDEADLVARLPRPRGPANHLFDPVANPMNRYGVPSAPLGVLIGPGQTIEEVR